MRPYFSNMLMAVTIGSLLVFSCSLPSGQETDTDSLGLQSCASDDDCEPFGYCLSDVGICTADCYDDADCWLTDPSYVCSHYRCVADLCSSDPCTSAHKTRCEIIEGERTCLCDADYHEEGDLCVTDEVCAEDSCTEANRSVCNIIDGQVACQCDPGYNEVDGACVLESGDCQPELLDDHACNYRTAEECAAHGWKENCMDRECLPLGVQYFCHPDGKCAKACSIDYGSPEADSNLADWVGTWGGIFSTAVRTVGLPLVPHQDTVSKHNLLVKVSEKDGQLEFRAKICFLGIYNFKGDRIYPEDLAYMVVPEVYFNSSDLVTQTLDNPPPLKAGETFFTTRHWEVRGAQLSDFTCPEDPEVELCGAECYCVEKCAEALPTRQEYLDGDPRVWDQDDDGNPGMTTLMSGVLNGEIYSVQRWSTAIDGEVVSKDRIIGLNDDSNCQYQIDADNPALVYDIISQPHPEKDRSYYRLERMPNEATCEDVLAKAADEDDWIRYTIRQDPDYVPVEDEK